jgi:hypothetical protein
MSVLAREDARGNDRAKYREIDYPSERSKRRTQQNEQ